MKGSVKLPVFIDNARKLVNTTELRAKYLGATYEAEYCQWQTLHGLGSLMQTASLIITPNAYKESLLMATYPPDGSGDLSVTRATTATRVNSQGLVELVPYNLLQRSEQFDNATWLKFGNAAGLAPVVTPNAGIAPDGTLTADRLQFNSVGSTLSDRSILSQTNIPCTISSTYTMSFYVKAYSIGEVGKQLRVALEQGGVSQIITLTADYQRIVFSGVAVGALLNFLIETRGTFTTNTTANVLLWGAQLVEGTEAKDYYATETRLNITRLDYSLGSCPSILVEPQRTNLALWSEQFDNAGWGKANLSITANTSTSPSGLQTADTLNEGAVASVVHRLMGNFCAVSVGSNNAFSLYVKKDTMQYLRIVINDVNNVDRWIAAQFDLDNQTYTTGVGTITGSVITSASIRSVGNGWYRLTLVGSLAVTSQIYPIIFGSNGTAISSTDIRGGGSYTGTNKQLFIYGAQLEAGAYATSYIGPTTSASVTRNADSFTRTNVYSNNWITASGGTWFIELTNNRVLTRSTGADILQSLGLKDASGNGIVLRTLGTQRHNISKYIANTPTELFVTTTNSVKIAVKWNGTTLDVFQNGVKVVSGSAFTTTNMTTLSTTAVDIPKEIKSMALFPTPLTDAELIQLTTI